MASGSPNGLVPFPSASGSTRTSGAIVGSPGCYATTTILALTPLSLFSGTYKGATGGWPGGAEGDASSHGGAEGDPVLRPGVGGFAADASSPRDASPTDS